jgi:putative Mg2+ transporter-C (MgtC) family protein
MTQLFVENQEIIIKLLLSMSLGMLIGMERYLAHKSAGMRTYALLAMGSTLFMILADFATNSYINSEKVSLTPLAIMAAIITGIGFLGAGAMFRTESSLTGLTTATGLWVSAGVGIAVGFGCYFLATISTFFILFIFVILWMLEVKFLDKFLERSQKQD